MKIEFLYFSKYNIYNVLLNKFTGNQCMIFCTISVVGITANPFYVLIYYKTQHRNNNCYFATFETIALYICEFDSATKHCTVGQNEENLLKR